MAYGSGKPVWSARGGDAENGIPNRRSNATNSGNSNGSYQRGEVSGGSGGYNSNNNSNNNSNYQAPQLATGAYADQQTHVVQDTMRTHVQAETTANTVLASLHAQRQQLQNANDDTWQMRTNVANAQRELKELKQKAFMKKQRLYMIIGLLAVVDLTLFFRIVQCGGSFFCRRY
mmetsp:Transcript_24170/g.52130  ORF Transcript_24170/g.52130 Transcript_24170/m.52130 type:complete len:174 (-) Transcript_24170:170-691(-)|eukprot:CAMPEP_0172313938 /NCGR_PEP_ID=MMETSP1058-20130122/21292_1 /TAXON_ID=83371 /ORGANISM="Detonula confervacea, Strain CCMP 353" /LENGTH=173 /DNA_ID=CAMNT_0013027677 /DNA_START=233 /DNA_END=754 /DNA_ORIENTATION=+